MQVVEKALRRSMSRMQVDSLDCVQFHWWDYEDKRYLDAVGHLADLQQEGLIRRSEVDTLITHCCDLEVSTEGSVCLQESWRSLTLTL